MFSGSCLQTDAIQHQGEISGVAIADTIKLDLALKGACILLEVNGFII